MSTRASQPPPSGPAPSASSAFRARGLLYVGTQTFFQERSSRGLAALTDEIGDPALRAFITQKFVPMAWYDVLPVPDLIAAEARAVGMPLDAYLLHRTRWQAKRDLGGVFAYLLRVASPALVASQLPKVMTQMFDFARADVVEEGERERLVRFVDVPRALHPWLSTSLVVYAETAMRLAGASSVDARSTGSTETGLRGGIPVGTLAVQLRWDAR
jgi:hypothetical protein